MKETEVNQRKVKILKSKQGITLIALVITIIVLLILAGVTINMLFGENGILKQAQNAKEKTEQAELEEQINLKIVEKNLASTETKTLGDYLSEIEGVDIVQINSDTWKVTKGNVSITVSDEENNTFANNYDVWDGEKQEVPEIKNFNWYIYTSAQLKFLADFVNNGNALTDVQKEMYKKEYGGDTLTLTADNTVYLMNNLDLGARPNSEGNWEVTENDKYKWESIGIDGDTKKMLAIFEGNNHTIKGVYVNKTTDYAGLFGNSNSIQNLTIKDSYIKGANCTGGIVGYVRGGTIKNCHNLNTTCILIEGSFWKVGGVVGRSDVDVINCSNSGKVTGLGIVSAYGTSQCGGVAGIVVSGKIENCYNTGYVESYGGVSGGVVGYVVTSVEVTGCNNSGTILGHSGENCGGVVGYALGPNTISRCYNTGNVTGKDYLGGVLGGSNKTGVTMSECYNTGDVSGTSRVGGVLGLVSGEITQCYNTGKVLGTEYVGGIIGDCTKAAQHISYCYNSGAVTGGSQIGGISGYLGAQGSGATETKCYNKGNVIYNGTDNEFGGIVGKMASDASVTNCYYLNSIGVSQGVGAINDGGDLDEQNKGAKATNTDFKTYQEFIKGIDGL